MTEGKFVLLNGELLDSTTPYLKDNRSFKYGDGLFESIRIINGLPYNLSVHLDRLKRGARVLEYNIPENFNLAFVENQIRLICQRNEITAGGRVRINIFRSGEGTFFPTTNDFDMLVTVTGLDENLFSLNKEGLLVDVYKDMYKHNDIMANYKTANAMVYVMAANYARKHNFDDCLILDSKGKVLEACSSNIFLVSNGVLYTPPLEDGCVGGTMRMTIINAALESKRTVYESPISLQHLLMADELFLTNAIKGVQWIGGYKSKRYFAKISKEMVDLLNQKQSNLKLDLREN